MNIATALDRKYVNYTIVMLTSLCMNNPVHVKAYLLHHELLEEDIQYMQDCLARYDIELIPIMIDEKKFQNNFQQSEYWCIESYYRLLMIEYLPASVERIMYLDADIIINKPLKECYEADFHGKDMLVCPDWSGRKS